MKTKHLIILVACVFALLASAMIGLPKYNVWQKEMQGKAAFAEAEQNRQILIEEAKANLEAEKLNAQAEVERAKGMAEAMKIENGQLTATYNQYLLIRNMGEQAKKGKANQIFYLPSSGLLPVMDIKK